MSSGTSERERQGRKFAAAADDYARGRPDYPVAAVDAAAVALGLDPGATVVDLAAGTGKLTRALAARFNRVLAVEPLPPMRELLVAHLPQVEVRGGTAEHLPLAEGEVDAVFVAEAFHWFDAPVALAEAARVLSPGGGIALLWQVPAGPWQPPLPEPARELVQAAIARGGEPGGPRRARGQWREAFAGSAFEDPHEDQFPHEFVQDREGVIAHLLSISSLAGLPAGDREALRARLRELVPETVRRQPLTTELHWARLAPVGWCDRCGQAPDQGPHTGCAAARRLEPPRFCRHCRRRMQVQVLPSGWTAACAAHGTISATPAR